MYVEESDFYPDDEPFADPSVRLNYQAALGEFIVTFNELDDLVTKLVGYAYQVIKRPLPKNIGRNFASKVDLLDAFGGVDLLKLSGAPIGELRDIAEMRNTLAHGYVDQSSFSEAFVVKPGDTKGKVVKAKTIEAWSDRATRALERLKYSEAVYWFGHVSPLSELSDPAAKS
jgi:hypothetical protein